VPPDDTSRRKARLGYTLEGGCNPIPLWSRRVSLLDIQLKK
jgi:hypothetical protein